MQASLPEKVAAKEDQIGQRKPVEVAANLRAQRRSKEPVSERCLEFELERIEGCRLLA